TRRKSTERNKEARGGRSSYEVLDEHYISMQEQGFTVMEIAIALNVDRNRIYDYINKYDLPAPIKKSRHVGA
ncbi:MAG TPA: hypothetical protein DEF04_09765, partial [Clostridiales bacterium]|nr:hypothetical protein [Clostridiales bacterium]